MKLLFIYFYEKKAVFQKATIVRFSKKYDVEVLKDTKNNKTFSLTLDNEFEEGFYSDNIDIGVITGENGTGKSILIDSIRNQNNNYSLIIYENDDEFFFMNYEHDNISINIGSDTRKITKIDNFQYIYYSSIIDTSKDDTRSPYNISNRNLLSKYDDLKLHKRLSLIENDDIHKYFNLAKENALKYVQIKKLKLNPSNNYFNEIEELLSSDYENILNAMFEISRFDKVKGESFIKKLFGSLQAREQEKIIDEIFLSHDNVISFLQTNYKLSEKYFKYINNTITKVSPNKKLIEKYDNVLKEYIFYLKGTSEYKKQEQYILDELKYYFEHGMENVKYNNDEIEHFIWSTLVDSEISYIDYFIKFMDTIEEKERGDIFHDFEGNENFFNIINFYSTNSLFDDIEIKLNKYISKETDLNTLKRKISHFFLLNKISYLLRSSNIGLYNFDRRTYSEVIYQMFYNDMIDINMIRPDMESMYEIVISNVNDFIYDIMDYNFTMGENTKKLLFILSFNEYYSNIKDDLNKIKLLNYLNTIYLQKEDILLYKTYITNKENKTLLEKINLFSKELKVENNNVVLDLNEDFFNTYDKLIKYSIKPFTYEVYPPLSSGQKAILFIFARINHAIRSIGNETIEKNILILLDEADLKLHLEWQRNFVADLVKFLNNFSNKKFYILYATHSPMILSDITDSRTVFLKKQVDNFSIDMSEKEDTKKRTFGANIYDLYHDSFFMESFIGAFANNKIKDVINLINLYKIATKYKKDKVATNAIKIPFIEYFIDENRDSILETYHKIFKEKIDYKNHKIDADHILENIKSYENSLYKIITCIGEPLLKNKLLDDMKYIFDSNEDIRDIVKKLKTKKFNEIKDELHKYPKLKQDEIINLLLRESND